MTARAHRTSPHHPPSWPSVEFVRSIQQRPCHPPCLAVDEVRSPRNDRVGAWQHSVGICRRATESCPTFPTLRVRRETADHNSPDQHDPSRPTPSSEPTPHQTASTRPRGRFGSDVRDNFPGFRGRPGRHSQHEPPQSKAGTSVIIGDSGQRDPESHGLQPLRRISQIDGTEKWKLHIIFTGLRDDGVRNLVVPRLKAIDR